MYTIQCQYNRNYTLIKKLGDVWLSAVKTSHFFLTEKDIKRLYPLVLDALCNVPHLLTITHENNYIAFMGIEQRKIEMLFISEQSQKKGIGTQLLNHAINAYRCNLIDVNEENTIALSFYQKKGFIIFDKSNHDELGNPFPILHLKLN